MTYLLLVMDLIRGFMDVEIPVLGEILVYGIVGYTYTVNYYQQLT